MLILEGKLYDDLLEIVLERAPHEAVGLIFPDGRVEELTNQSDTPETRFEVHKAEVVSKLDDLSMAEDVILWHSHPNGGVGPSRIDMQQKTPFADHLVVALVEGTLVSSWY